jgi:hypothetical protein
MEASAPVSLYLDLAENEVADIEVVARAALAWSAAIKELAFVVDPSVNVTVELVSGTEGSLGLNACIKAVSKLASQQPKISTIVITSLTWFTLQTAAYSYEKVLDWLTGQNAPAVVRGLTHDEIVEIAREVAKAAADNVAAPQRQQVFRELEKDHSIVGVGATQTAGTRPSLIIPRSDFSRRAGQTVATTEDVKRRMTAARLDVILVSPTLKDAERSWKFQIGSLPEFGATMKDHGFLNAFAAGRITIPLRPGVGMEIELETKEEFEGEVWVTKERSVTRVYRPGQIDDPQALPLAPPKQD